MFSLGTQVVDDPSGYFNIFTKVYVTYPDLEGYYDDVTHDFNTIKRITIK